MRKGRDGGEKKGKMGKEKTTGKKEVKNDDYNGHYVIASSKPPERRPLERHTLVPIRIKYVFERNFFLGQEIYSCDKKFIPVTRYFVFVA